MYPAFGFFFQAEDGIRDADVTGVQTCALPISRRWPRSKRRSAGRCANREDARHMSTRNKVLLGAGAAVLIVSVGVISAGARRVRGQEVRLEKAGRRDLVAAVTASGKIQPHKQVDISADIIDPMTIDDM